MIALKIDGRRVAVEPGTTILEAASRLGIRIPTMCHVPGLEPATSCFLCAVQIQGRRTLSPSCAMPVSDGMSVVTNSDDVRAARRMALELLLSDHAGECVAPCAAECPAGLDIAGFVSGIATGDARAAIEVISRRLALPGTLGRICPRLCEQQCRRREFDEALAIGALHQYAAEEDPGYVPPLAPASGKSVAIVGAGPAGLAAAFYLLQKGHACTLFDAHADPGGMLRYAIPEYRLPREALDREIDVIRRMGAEFRMNQRWGEHFSLTKLRATFDAVFLAIGAQRAQAIRCEGEELALSGIQFLESVSQGNAPSLGDDVAVIGGGNTAMDCARSAIRLGAPAVRVLYRRSREEMPCLMAEVEGAEAEGVHIEFLSAPVRLERKGGALVVTCRRMALGEPDASGRRSPVPIEGSDYTLECSSVIAAIGQSVDRSLAEREGLRVTGLGLEAQHRTLATNLPGVFAGGDAVLGADLAVRAVAAGRIAAASIDQFLRGEPVTGETLPAGISLRPVDDAELAAMFRGIEKAGRRIAAPTSEVTRDGAEREARRCLTCGCAKADCCLVRSLATEYEADTYRYAGQRRRFSRDDSHLEIVYEPGKCINCSVCVRIAAADGETLGLATIGRGFEVAVGVPFGRPLAEGLVKTARRCAEACPSGALALRVARSCDAGCCAVKKGT